MSPYKVKLMHDLFLRFCLCWNGFVQCYVAMGHDGNVHALVAWTRDVHGSVESTTEV